MPKGARGGRRAEALQGGTASCRIPPMGRTGAQLAVAAGTGPPVQSPRLRGSEAPRLRGSEAPRLRGSEAPRLRGSEAPRLRGSAGAGAHPLAVALHAGRHRRSPNAASRHGPPVSRSMTSGRRLPRLPRQARSGLACFKRNVRPVSRAASRAVANGRHDDAGGNGRPDSFDPAHAPRPSSTRRSARAAKTVAERIRRACPTPGVRAERRAILPENAPTAPLAANPPTAMTAPRTRN